MDYGAVALEILWNLRFGIFPFMLIAAIWAKLSGDTDRDDAQRNTRNYIEPW